MSAQPIGKLMTEQEVADRLAISRALLRKWRANQCGPTYLRLGTRIRYPANPLEEWIVDNMTKNSS